MKAVTSFVSRKRRILARLLPLVLLVALITVMISQTVFAQNTYVITDGDQVKVYTSYATDPIAVLNEAGFELDADDFYTTQLSDGVSEITVQRCQNITVDYCGNVLAVSSYGETLEELLSRLDIGVYGDLNISLPLNTQTYDGMQVSVSRIVETEETYTVDMPYDTTYCYDSSLPAGKQQILIPGVSGEARCTASVVYVNGKEQSRVVMQQTVTKQPIEALVAIGTGEDLAPAVKPPVIKDGMIITADGEVLTYDRVDQYYATAYTSMDEGCDEWTAIGTRARVGAIAVDPTIIPYGTRMFIVSNDGEYIYGISCAEDCGSSIKGKRIDLFMETLREAFQFGERYITVYFLT